MREPLPSRLLPLVWTVTRGGGGGGGGLPARESRRKTPPWGRPVDAVQWPEPGRLGTEGENQQRGGLEGVGGVALGLL